MKHIENLQHNIWVIFPRHEGSLEDFISVHADDAMSDFLVSLALLDSIKKFDGDPLFCTLPQSGHDLGNTVRLKRLWLYVVDILLIIFASLLPAGLLSDSCFPAISIIDTQRFNSGMREFGGVVCLRLAANEPSTVGLAAVTGLGIGPIAIDVVVENEFLACFDSSFGEDAHAQLVAYDPFVDKAIRIARVVAEAAEIALFGSINKLALGERHEVEVLDALLVILHHASPEGLFFNHLTNILENEITRLQVHVGSESKAFLVGFDDGNVGILPLLKTLILALTATATVANALHFGSTIDAIRVIAAGIVDPFLGVCGYVSLYMVERRHAGFVVDFAAYPTPRNSRTRERAQSCQDACWRRCIRV